MIKKITFLATLAVLCGWLGLNALAQDNAASAKVTGEITAAAKKFLALLDK